MSPHRRADASAYPRIPDEAAIGSAPGTNVITTRAKRLLSASLAPVSCQLSGVTPANSMTSISPNALKSSPFSVIRARMP